MAAHDPERKISGPDGSDYPRTRERKKERRQAPTRMRAKENSGASRTDRDSHGSSLRRPHDDLHRDHRKHSPSIGTIAGGKKRLKGKGLD